MILVGYGEDINMKDTQVIENYRLQIITYVEDCESEYLLSLMLKTVKTLMRAEG